MRVTSKVGNLPSKFRHDRPLGSRVIHHVRNGQTERVTKATLIAPSLWWRRHNNSLKRKCKFIQPTHYQPLLVDKCQTSWQQTNIHHSPSNVCISFSERTSNMYIIPSIAPHAMYLPSGLYTQSQHVGIHFYHTTMFKSLDGCAPSYRCMHHCLAPSH